MQNEANVCSTKSVTSAVRGRMCCTRRSRVCNVRRRYAVSGESHPQCEERVCNTISPGGVLPDLEVGGGLDPKFASKNISDKYPNFCPPNFRYDPKIGTFPQLCVLW